MKVHNTYWNDIEWGLISSAEEIDRKIEYWISKQNTVDNNHHICWLSKHMMNYYEFTIDHLKNISIEKELNIVKLFFYQNHYLSFILFIMLQISVVIVRHGSEFRWESIWINHASFMSLLKMLFLLYILLWINITLVILYTFSKDLSTNNKFNGIYGYWQLEKIGVLFLSNEVFGILSSFSNVATWLLSKMFKINVKTVSSLYLFIIQIIAVIFTIKLMGSIKSNWEVIVLFAIHLIFQFEKVATIFIAADFISSIFTVSKDEIEKHGLDKIWVLCQDVIHHGALLSWNHVYHQEWLKEFYSVNQSWLYCQHSIDFPQPISKLQKRIVKERSSSY